MLRLSVTPGISELLNEVASCSGIPDAAREDAQRHQNSQTILWDNLKSLVEAYRSANPGKPVYLHKICKRNDIVLEAPPPKEKSPELQARLVKLQQELDNKRYADMVADITENERKAEEMRDSVLPTARLQLSFGAHVIVTMFTFWAVSYYGSKFYLGFDELWAGLAGALGLTVGLLVETLLLIIRTNRVTPLEERMPELFDKAKVDEAFAQLRALQEEQRRAAAQGKRGGKGGGKGKGKPAAGAAAGPAQAGPAGAGQAESKKAR